jgi:hypothetical protein
MVCERGASFGYNNLVSDMRSLAIMRETGCPVVFDATHSVQLPGGQGDRLGRPARVRAGAGAGRGRGRRFAACSWRPTPIPAKALSDGPNAWPLPQMAALLEQLLELDALIKRRGWQHEQAGIHDARSSDPERGAIPQPGADCGRLMAAATWCAARLRNAVWQPQRLVILEFPNMEAALL